MQAEQSQNSVVAISEKHTANPEDPQIEIGASHKLSTKAVRGSDVGDGGADETVASIASEVAEISEPAEKKSDPEPEEKSGAGKPSEEKAAAEEPAKEKADNPSSASNGDA